jgi:hypothetical protein
MTKPFTDAQYALKAAVRRAVKMAGGCHAAAEVVRVDAARLSRYGNIDAPEFAPIDVCFELDRAAGSPEIARALAGLEGCDLTPRDDILSQIARDVTSLAGDIAKDSGDLVSTAIEASHDGKLTINEAKSIDDRAADLQDKVVDIRKAARKTMTCS